LMPFASILSIVSAYFIFKLCSEKKNTILFFKQPNENDYANRNIINGTF